MISRFWGRTAKPVLCAGMYSSGSTWLYNLVAEVVIKKLKGEETIIQLFADNIESLPQYPGIYDYIVMKSHNPSGSLQYITKLASGPIILTVREPRDAVASLIDRFGICFETAYQMVIQSANNIANLSTSADLILRYEDRFYDNEKSVKIITETVDLELSDADQRKIFRELSRENVKKEIQEFHDFGGFGSGPPVDTFIPIKHWHPGHIGNQVIGKFQEILTQNQQINVLVNTKRYCQIFGFPEDGR